MAGPGTADLEGPKAVRAAMGGLWDVRLAQTNDLGATLDALRRSGLALYGADLDGEPAAGWRPRDPAALVAAFGTSTRSSAAVDAAVHIIERGLLGR